MVKYSSILKAIEMELNKCHSTAVARNIGKSVIKEDYANSRGEKYARYSYNDGTVLTIKKDSKDSKNGTPVSLTTSDGKTYEYLGDDSYEHFQHQKDMLISKYGEETYEMVQKFSDLMETTSGIQLKAYLEGRWTLDYIYDSFKVPRGDRYAQDRNKAQENFEYLLQNNERYEQICKDNDLRSYGDFITLEVTGNKSEREELTKNRIYITSNHSDESSGASFDEVSRQSAPQPTYIITIREQNNPANTGLFTGNAITEWRQNNEIDGVPRVDGTIEKDKDLKMNIHTVKGQRFENILIDDERVEDKVIIRKPHRP